MQNSASVSLSIVIPMGPGEQSWRKLLPQLVQQFQAHEWIFSICDTAVGEMLKSDLNDLGDKFKWRIVQGSRGRAMQINRGISLAEYPWIWVLHSDTFIPAATDLLLQEHLKKMPKALHYFNLDFIEPSMKRMAFNRWGVWLRSRYLKMPFGDQGFAFHRDLWSELGGFPEDVAYGEDHIFVWKARQASLFLNGLPGKLFTSARKYESNGWLFTSLTHIYLTFLQAAPQCWKLCRMRCQVRLSKARMINK